MPAGLLAAIPFALTRPTFEALQRGLPGLLLALLRYLLLAFPLALGGAEAARALGYEPLLGVAAGLILGSAATSLAGGLWLRAALRALPGR